MIRCPNCGREQPASVILCDCGYDLEKYRQAQAAKTYQRQLAERPYQWLPILQVVLRVVGAITILSGLLYSYTLYANEESFALILAYIAATIAIAVPAFAFADAINVLLDIRSQNDEIVQRLKRIEEAQEK